MALGFNLYIIHKDFIAIYLCLTLCRLWLRKFTLINSMLISCSLLFMKELSLFIFDLDA